MNQTRRGFLGALAAMVAAPVVAEVDMDRLLWVSGAKLISIPKPKLITESANHLLSIQDITFEMLMILKEKMDAEYDKDFSFLSGAQWSEDTRTARSYLPINRISETLNVRKPQRLCS